jgi:hypothetical protein
MVILFRSLCHALFVSAMTVCCLTGSIPSTISHAQSPDRIEVQSAVPAKSKPVIEMTIDELREFHPSVVRDLEFSANQDLLASLLVKTGERVQAFFRDFSDTSSKEYVLLQKLRYSGSIDESTSRDFYYLIVYHPNEKGPILEEYRTDMKNHAVGQDAIPGFFMTSGYACLSLYFHPSNRQGLRFRYLGKQNSESRAHVLAFAEKLEMTNYMIQYKDSITGKSTRLPLQGFAWIDSDTYQILRLRINLQSTGKQSLLSEQTTDVHYSENHIGTAQLWLPREVIVTTIYNGRTYRNLHRYSDYHLFAVKSDFKIDQPKSKSN